jgi:DNA-binding CsgD family transcriptional regulator
MAVLGLVARWSGDLSGAMEWLGEADRQAAAFGWGEPSVRWWSGDQIELLLELGRIQDAIRVLDVWEADAARVARAWVLAHVTRCRGLVAAAQGEVDRAGFLLGRAVAQHSEVGDPFGRARALLALGILRRRERKKRGSREAIDAALDGFDQLGAATWIVKARSELGSIGGRTREEGLTPAERRVAALVVEGRTNREVAAALFVTERTVASHLSHVYAKLGVRSRTELARQLR